LTTKKLSSGTQNEYRSTVAKWLSWGKLVSVDEIEKRHIREFLDWVHEKATSDGGSNGGRTANKARENLRALMSWAWEQAYVKKLPRFPQPMPQRDVAGRHYLTKSDLNALYFATFQLARPQGWRQPFTVGHYWRAALVLFFNYGVDSGTVFKCAGFHEPILWRHVTWRREAPNGKGREWRYRCLFHRRMKTGKQFQRPMNRVVYTHLKSIRSAEPLLDQPVFDCSSSRPNTQFQLLCQLAGVKPKQEVETGEDQLWVLRDLRKTCAT
jgi:hypothetical protein